MSTLSLPDYQSLFEKAPGLYLVLLPDFTIEAASDAYLSATMTKREAILGRGLFEVFPPDDNEATGVSNLRASLNYVLQHRQAHTMDVQKYDIRRRDGIFEVRYWSPLNSPVLNAENELVYIIHNVTDITIRQIAEERIRFLATIAGNIQDPIIVSDNNFCTSSWNEAAEKLFEWKSEEVIGKPTREMLRIIYPGLAREQILQSFTETGYWQGEVIYHTKSGKPLNILATASQLKDVKENVTGILVLAKDITDRINAEKQLKEFEHFFNNNNDLCGIANTVGYFETINTNFSKVLGYSEKEFCETAFIELIHPDDVATTLREYDRLKSGELTINFINRYRKKDGSYIYFDWNVIPNPSTGKLYCVARDITDRKIAESALKESEEQIHAIFRNAPDAVVVIDEEGKIIKWNPRAEAIFGWLAAEVTGKHLHETIIPQHFREAHIKGMNQFLKTGEGPILNKQIELPAFRKDNTTFNAGISISPTLMKGKYVFIGFISDITDRKKAEDALNKLNQELEQRVKERTAEIEKKEKRFRALVENNYDIISLMDESFNIIYRSPSASRITGWTNEDMKDMNGTKNIHPDDLESAKKIIQEIMTNPGKAVNVSFRNKHKRGHYLWVEGTVINLLQDEDVKAIVFNFRDVTERIDADIKIKQTLKELSDYKFALDESSIVAITDENGIISYVNNNFCKISKYKRTQLIGQDHRILNSGHHPKEFIRYLWATITDGKIWKGEIKNKAKDGSIYWVDTTIVPFLDEKGKPYQYVTIRVDITERKLAEEKLVSSEMFFRSLIENSTEGVSLTDEFNNLIYRSPASQKITGQLSKENMLTRLHPEYLEPVKNKISEVITKPGVPVPFQARFLHAAGHYYWMEGTITNMLHVKGVNAIVSNYHDITQRKELEVLLHKANALARIGGWEVDLINGTVYWSDITRQIHEVGDDYVPDLATGMHFYKEGKDRDLIAQKVKEAIELGTPWDAELQIVTLKNNGRWIRTIGETEFVNGKCVRICGSLQDIDQRKKADEKIIASEKRFRHTLDNMLEGIQIHDFNWRYIYVNNTLIKYSKSSREGLLGHTLMEKYPGIEQTGLFKIMQRCMDERVTEQFETEFIFPDGTKTDFELSIQPVPEGLFILSIDITERKKAEAAILRAEANYREIFDKASDAIYVHEMGTGKVIEVNQRAADITGFSKEEIISSNPEVFITANPQFTMQHAYDYLQKAAAGEPQLFDWLSKKKDGSYSWLEVNLKKANIAGEERILAFFREINDRKKAQLEVQKLNEELEQKIISRTEQLRKTNEELEAFSYSVSHDLRAPLRAIVGYTTILEEDYSSKLDNEAKRLTAVIKKNTVKMGNLIDDLLAFSRMGRHEMVKTNVNSAEMVHEIIKGMDNYESNTIKWTITSLPAVKADANMIRQVWVNLLLNAIKYTGHAAIPTVEVGSIKQNGHIVFYVKDNGVGFDEKYKNKLFKVFQRLHSAGEFEGTGIGLAIVEKIISKHGGKVWAEAAVNKGATFYFSLPGE